jgi:hypothetical protein
MQRILYKIYFWKIFHMYYKSICILYALLGEQNFILVKSGCYMQSSIWQMVRTRTSEDDILNIPEGSVGCGRGQVPRGGAPPPQPISLEQLLATQNDLMRRLIENDERRGAERQQPRHQERDSSYSDFLATHPLVFANATDPLEADSWLCTT